MNSDQPTSFDLETVAMLRDVLDEAWTRLSAKERTGGIKSLLAERILRAAAAGERDRGRLVDAARRSDLAA